MLPRTGLHVVTVQVCLLCLTAFAQTGVHAGRAGGGKEQGATGQWGEWGEWSTCSAECSTGITVRSRLCQHPHMLPVASLLSRGDDSVHCEGSDKEIKLCNKQACGGGRPPGGWREEECAKYDASVHGGQRYTWQPFIHPSDPCKLTCRAKGHHFYSNLANRVVDGTPCAGATTNPTAVCLQGQCQKVGCDDLVGSPWRADACGVCKGDNSTCRKISGIFARQDVKRGLNQIVVIPPGSTRIRVKGLRYSSNWLALQGADGEYLLNGGQKRSAAMELEAAGTVFSYKTKRRCAGQCLVAKGPTDQPLTLMLNTRGRNRGVMYSFNIPLNVSDRYFRRILDSARPRANLLRNVTVPQLPHRARGNRRYGQRGPVNSADNNGGSSSTVATTTTTVTTTTTTTTPTSTTTTAINNVNNDESDEDSGSSNNQNQNIRNNNDLLETTTDRAVHTDEGRDVADDDDDFDDDDTEDGAEESDLGDEAADDSAEEGAISRPDPVRVNASPDQLHGHRQSVSRGYQPPAVSHSESDEAVVLNSQSNEETPESPEHGEDNKRPFKITRKEKPRFIDSQTRTKESFGDEAWSLGLQPNAQEAGSDGELGHSQALHADRGRQAVGLDPENSQAEEIVAAEAVPAVEDRSEAAAESDVSESSDSLHSDLADGRSNQSVRPQSDGPTQQHRSPSSSYRVTPGNRPSNRRRSWRRFRRPKYSQSFTFRGRHSQGKEEQDQDVGGDDRRTGQHQRRPLHITGGQRYIRYRQQPQGQVGLRGRPAIVSAYGQSPSGRTPSYSGGNAYVRRRQYPSQRQALRAGQSSSQNQEGSLQLARGNIQRPQGGNVDFTEDANARQRSRPDQVGAEQENVGQRGRPSGQLDDYQRQLLRRRQLIEQRIAAQNAAYQRRLEERNERLRQQHLEQQQRLRHQNVSQVSRQESHSPQAQDKQERQNLPQERDSVKPSGSSLPAGSHSSPHRTRIDPRTRQPSESAFSVRRPEHSRRTPPVRPSDPDGNVEAVGRGRPLIISNRRQSVPPGRNPLASLSPPEVRPSRPGQVESGALAGQAAGSVFPRRPVPPVTTPSPAVTGGDSPLKEGRTPPPLIIPNQRQTPQQGKSSFPSSGTGTPGIPASSAGSLSGASAGQPDQVDRRRWPLLISNRRQGPVTPSGDLAGNSAPGVESQGGIPRGRDLESSYRPPQPQGPSQIDAQDVDNQGAHPNTPPVPGVASLGGGFVAPQYIPENTRTYDGQSELSASIPNQLPSGGDSPLVIGASGNVIPNAVDSSVAVGEEGGGLTIDEGDDVSWYEWRVSGLTDCTLTCGGGVQQTVVVCLDTRTQAFVTDDNCQRVQRPETKALTCNTRPCPAQWQPGEWSPCSVSCGPGEQTRLVHCLARVSPTLNVTMADENCQTAEKPATRQACQTGACNSWRVGNWSQCSVQCGEGVRTRDVYCTDQTGYDVSDDQCSSAGSKPSHEEVCVTEPCGKGWYYTRWPRQCPARCGSGTKERHVTCLGDGGAPLPESSCSVSSRPQAQQACRADSPCGGQWFVGEWTQCNVTCGRGHQEREVICMKGLSEGLLSMVDAENCLEDEKPAKQQPCEMTPCESEWYMTSWTECSQSCGTGHRTREVKCLDPQKRDSDQCPLADKPASREACNTASCVTTPPPVAAGAECRDTFSRCQLVKHARMCRYAFYRKKCCATCGLDT